MEEHSTSTSAADVDNENDGTPFKQPRLTYDENSECTTSPQSTASEVDTKIPIILVDDQDGGSPSPSLTTSSDKSKPEEAVQKMRQFESSKYSQHFALQKEKGGSSNPIVKCQFETCQKRFLLQKSTYSNLRIHLKGGVVVTDNASNMRAAFQLQNILEETNDIFEEAEDENIGPDDVPSETEMIMSDEDEDFDEQSVADDLREESSESDFSDDDASYGDPEQPPFAEHLGCVAHSLQLSINKTLLLPEAKNLINRIQRIMTFFKKSPMWTAELRKETNIDIKFKGITRWNSTLDMIQRFKTEEFFEGIRKVLDIAEKQLKPSGPTAMIKKLPPPSARRLNEKDQAEALYSILRPAGDATDKLQSECCTSNLVILSLLTVTRRLQKLGPLNHFETTRLAMLENIKSRFDPILQKEEYILSTILDPRLKCSLFNLIPVEGDLNLFPLSVPSQARAIELIKAHVEFEESLLDQEQVSQNSDSNPATNKEPSFDILMDAIQVESVTRGEVDMYLWEPLVKAKDCSSPLTFWKENTGRYRMLSKLAQRYLSIPATSGGLRGPFLLLETSEEKPEAESKVVLQGIDCYIATIEMIKFKNIVVVVVVSKANNLGC